MLYYLLFWMLMGLFIHFYIIFGTNLLTQGPVQIVVFCLFQCFAEKEYQTESKRNETFGSVIFGTSVIQRTWSDVKQPTRIPRGRGARPSGGAPPTLMTASFVPWSRVQVSWITFDEKITFPKVSFRLDSV